MKTNAQQQPNHINLAEIPGGHWSAMCMPGQWRFIPPGGETMQTYSDDYLNHYADRYMAMQLKRHGVTLDQYLANPARYEVLALEPFPALPAQLAVQRQIDAETARQEASIEHLPRRDGVATEPLRHHRYPRRSLLGFFARKAKA